MARWAVVVALFGACWSPAQLVQPPRCADAAAGRCTFSGSSQTEYNFIVDGLTLSLEYTDSGYFILKCPEGLSLNNSALPSFESQLRVNKVYFENCLADCVYADVLERLNVAVLDKLVLTNAGNVTAARLARLGHLAKLQLEVAELAPAALAALPALRRLHLDRVRLPAGELRRLPRDLEWLVLFRDATDVTAADLAALPRLSTLVVNDSASPHVAVAGPALRRLTLQLPAVRLPARLPAPLENVSVSGWAEARPEPWRQCAPRLLELRELRAERLPAGWLARCAALRELSVDGAERLARLEAAALHGAAELRRLTLRRTALQYLPPGLLDDAPLLELLDLSENRLLELPGGLFAKTNILESLNLSYNQLTQSVLQSLSAVTSLVTLDLGDNDLTDCCGGLSGVVREFSHLQYLKQLKVLKLKNANISMICRDWRYNMPYLRTLDLSGNEIKEITFADMQFYTLDDVDVELAGNNVTALRYTRHDYARALAAAPARGLLRLPRPATLRCDCRSYWAARAFLERPAHAALVPRCAGGRLLARAPAELWCDGAGPGLRCAAPAACSWRPGEPRAALRLRCEAAGLRSVRAALQAVQSADAVRTPLLRERYDWELFLAHNTIDRVAMDDLPPNLMVLDLRNNSVSSLGVDTARALVEPPAQLYLAGNPLRCDCGAAHALDVLRDAAGLRDRRRVVCAGGGPLQQARPAPCAGPPAALLGAAAALLTALLLAALLAAAWRRPGLRLRVKAALHRRGWLPAAPEPDDEARRFDVFVSFSHGDERFVREQLAARLESGPAPYRLCLHYRDWAPGGWIPAQIAASVRASRRTVAVVSDHFLRSSWARAEFQEAHALALRDARPRLVVVLLEDPAKLPLDDKLRRYLASNTYVRWGDPWFWEKLYLALPRGRGTAAPAPAPAPASASGPATTAASAALHDLDNTAPLDPEKSSLMPLTPAQA